MTRLGWMDQRSWLAAATGALARFGLRPDLDGPPAVAEIVPADPGVRPDFQPIDGLQRLDPLLVLRLVVAELRPEARGAGVTLLAPDPASGFVIAARPAALAELFRILLSNAIRHNRPGGVALVELRQTTDGLAVMVHDTGVGMDDDALAHLFRDAPGEPDVGLKRARRTARALGGRLTAASTPGLGSTFTLSLPADIEDDRRALVLPLRDPKLASLILLYIEPDPTCAALMRQVIGALGPSLHVSPNGEEGLTLARDLRPDAILVEPDLPGMDGLTLKARLDADPLTRGAPVIALSDDPDPTLARRGRQAGFAGWLTKPLDIRLFTSTLSRVLEEHGGSPGLHVWPSSP